MIYNIIVSKTGRHWPFLQEPPNYRSWFTVLAACHQATWVLLLSAQWNSWAPPRLMAAGWIGCCFWYPTNLGVRKNTSDRKLGFKSNKSWTCQWNFTKIMKASWVSHEVCTTEMISQLIIESLSNYLTVDELSFGWVSTYSSSFKLLVSQTTSWWDNLQETFIFAKIDGFLWFLVDLPINQLSFQWFNRGLPYRGSYALIGVKDGPALAEEVAAAWWFHFVAFPSDFGLDYCSNKCEKCVHIYLYVFVFSCFAVQEHFLTSYLDISEWTCHEMSMPSFLSLFPHSISGFCARYIDSILIQPQFLFQHVSTPTKCREDQQTLPKIEGINLKIHLSLGFLVNFWRIFGPEPWLQPRPYQVGTDDQDSVATATYSRWAGFCIGRSSIMIKYMTNIYNHDANMQVSWKLMKHVSVLDCFLLYSDACKNLWPLDHWKGYASRAKKTRWNHVDPGLCNFYLQNGYRHRWS